MCLEPSTETPPIDGSVVVPGDNIAFKVNRLADGPIVYPKLFGLDSYWTSVIAGNINGPSLLKVGYSGCSGEEPACV